MHKLLPWDTGTEALPEFIADPDPRRFLTENYVVLDFEIDTSFGDFGHPVHPENQMLLACWCLGRAHPAFEEEGRVYSLWGNEYQLDVLIDHLNAADLLVAHNAKYELGWLDRAGFDIASTLVFCTKIAEYVLSGNLKISTHLNDVAQRRGMTPKDPVVDHMMKNGFNPIDIPRPWLQGRCMKDVCDTEVTYRDQREHLDRTNRLGVMYARCVFTPVLADMEMQGMALDPERVVEEHARETQQAMKLEHELRCLCGDINLNSDQQMGEFIYDAMGFEELRDKRGEPIRTAGGQPKVDKDTLALLKAKTKEQKIFLNTLLAYNKSTGRLSKYLDFYLAVCRQQGGIFYASFNQTVTKTHRLSSSGMRIQLEHVVDDKGKVKEGGTQFQNQPNEYKRLFRAKRPGNLFTEEDGSGLEFRIAGLVGNDQAIKDDINNPDFDPHRRSAAIINNIEEDEVDKEKRRKAKAHTFKPLFGGQSGTKGEKRYYAAFNERYHQLVTTQEGWLAEVLATKRLVLPWGMQFYFPYVRMDRSGYVNERTKVFNAPIQSFATAEIIPIQATILWHMIRARGLQNEMIMVNTVHDSVLTELHPEYVDRYKSLVVNSWIGVFSFVESIYGMTLEGLPLGTEITVGEHWSEGEEQAFNVWKDRVEEA
jgi:DNA polymerase I-like protein with 3'-5' exonuclease and polymerase domains